MTIDIKFSGLIGQSAQIQNATQVVKRIWESRLDSRKNITINIELKFTDFTSDVEVLKTESASPRFLELRNKNPQSLTSDERKEFFELKSYLQSNLLGLTSTQNKFYAELVYNDFLKLVNSSSSSFSVNDKLAISSLERINVNPKFPKPVIRLTRSNAKALGIASDNSSIDAKIYINSNLAPQFTWEYNANDNTTSPKDQSRKDFIGTLSHEVGHALGFFTNNSSVTASSLDLFRFIPSQDINKIPALGGDGTRKYFSIDRGTTPENYFEFDDDNHFSQYTDNTDTANGEVKTVVGLMSPSILPRQDNNKKTRFDYDELQPTAKNTPLGRVVPGSFDRIRIADLVAFDIIGWDIKQINTGKITARAIKNKVATSVGETLLLDKGSTKLPTNLDDRITLAPANGTAVYGKGGYDTITGSDLRDTLDGGTEDDELYGGLGDDVIFGRENDDFIAGQDGNDALYGGVGEDRIDGGDGNEVEIQGNEGDDFLFGGNGNDKILGGANDDYLNGGTGNDNLDGGVGEDVLLGDDGNDVLSGNEGADQLDGGLGADTLSGGNGDDSYIIDNIADLITGETATSGIDSVISSVSLNLVNSIEDLTLIGTGNITGAGNDLANVLVGNDQKNILNGLGNDDTIYGNGGDDTLKGGTGNDFLDGGFAPRELIVEGSTAFILSGLDLLEGGAGNDTYVVSEGDIVTENLNEGNDTAIAAISYVLPKNVENLSLVDPTLISEGFVPGATNLIAGRDDAGDALLARREADLGLSEDSSSQKNRSNSQPIDPSILMATGNEVGNRISGNNDRNRLKGLDGNDTLEGAGGDDTIFGNEGNDSLSGGEGNDRLTGNNGQDILTGNNGDDYLVGGKGNDRINGDDGNDYLIGGRGADTLNGGKGDDVLLDGGKSLLTGGEGKDTFVVSGLATIITDFKIHEDSLKFEDLEEEYDDRLAISQVGQDTAISLDHELVVTLQGVNARSFIDSNHSFFWQKN